jgi:hypothetical protein
MKCNPINGVVHTQAVFSQGGKTCPPKGLYQVILLSTLFLELKKHIYIYIVGWVQRLKPIIPAMWEADIWGIATQGQSGQKVHEIPS